MQIRVKTNIDFDKITASFLEEVNKRVLIAFSAACKETVNFAKGNRAERYTDQTGALNASTGFQLYRDGELVEEYFEDAAGGSGEGNNNGKNTGKQVATEAAASLGAPIAAVVVAGMPYAIYVESKGYDVLTAAMHQMPDILKQKLEAVFNGTGVSFEITT